MNTDPLMSENAKVEELSAILHEIYMKEAERQGDVRHDWDYSKLSENTKEYDRVLARFILADRTKLEEEIRRLQEKLKYPDALSAFECTRLIEWMNDPKRKHSTTAFTASACRDAARAFEKSGVAHLQEKLRSTRRENFLEAASMVRREYFHQDEIAKKLEEMANEVL